MGNIYLISFYLVCDMSYSMLKSLDSDNFVHVNQIEPSKTRTLLYTSYGLESFGNFFDLFAIHGSQTRAAFATSKLARLSPFIGAFM